ncbi:CheR family methyltransferase [Nostoc sp. UHCC 0302]|uniref:CheR family methyltransferase n=1 Tax=Nostoc sp. UHCC 0302 TaxID=3134896 RepID=UPI00311CC113
MVLSAIATLLNQAIGLDPDTVGSNRIARAVENRRLDCKLPDIESYWARLQTSALELEELIELLIVPETWFFRDGKPFDYLKTYVTDQWRLLPNRNTLQLLSVPCSTGEEPYSMAIALLEVGLHPQQFAIDAIDISHRSLAKAKRGLYTKNSFRGEAWRERERYFQQTAEGYELCQSVRELVNFQQGNVMTSLVLTQKQYDIIFCRNLLIYLQSEACLQVLAAIDRLLRPGGLLFVGASETGKIVADQYTSIRQPFTFAYRKSESSLPQLESLNIIQSQSATPQNPVKQPLGVKNYSAFHSQQIQKSNISASLNGSSSQSTPSVDLQTVRKLADEGRSPEAMTLCKSYLIHHPTSAAAYLILGALYQADQQNHQAEQCFQRAIYLEPTSYQALVHLALLKEHQGDTVGAKIIQQRIQRLQSGLRTEA